MANTDSLQLNNATSASFTEKEILSYLADNGTIDLSGVVSDMKKDRRKAIIDNHPFSISMGKDSRWRTYVPDESRKNGRRLIAKSTLSKLEDELVRFYSNGEEETEKKSRITVEKLYEEWLPFKSLHTNSNSYVYRITTEWNKYYDGTPLANSDIKKLNTIQLEEWALNLIKENSMSKNQYYNATIIIREMMEYAVNKQLLAVNPFAGIKPDKKLFRSKKKPNSETQVFTKKEQSEFEAMAWEEFEARTYRKNQLVPLAAIFLFQTGLRISEVCALRYEDITGNKIRVCRMYDHFDKAVVDRCKSDLGERDVYLTDKAIQIIENARQRQIEENKTSNGYIFSMTEDVAPYHAIRKCFYKYCNRINTYSKGPHKARKTVISALIDEGVNINTIREMVGHADERTTYNSYCFDRSNRDERYKKIDAALS